MDHGQKRIEIELKQLQILNTNIKYSNINNHTTHNINYQHHKMSWKL